MQVMVSKKSDPIDQAFEKSGDAAKAVGQKLRQIYDDIANEPLPDDFVELLKKLDDNSEDNPDDGRK